MTERDPPRSGRESQTWFRIASGYGAVDSFTYQVRFVGPDLWEVVSIGDSFYGGTEQTDYGVVSALEALGIAIESAGEAPKDAREIRRSFRRALEAEGDAAGLRACFGRPRVPKPVRLCTIDGVGKVQVRTSYRSSESRDCIEGKLGDGQRVWFWPPVLGKRVVSGSLRTNQGESPVRIRINKKHHEAITSLLKDSRTT